MSYSLFLLWECVAGLGQYRQSAAVFLSTEFGTPPHPPNRFAVVTFEETETKLMRRKTVLGFVSKEGQVTPKLVAGSFMIIRSFLIVLGLLVGISSSTTAETVKLGREASTNGAFTIAQTNGQDRRDNRQDCRQQNGAVGADKRDCKQQGRQN